MSYITFFLILQLKHMTVNLFSYFGSDCSVH